MAEIGRAPSTERRGRFHTHAIITAEPAEEVDE